MASAPQAQGLPLFYNDLQPLSSELHGNYKVRRADAAPFLAKQHAVPLTVEEFPLVQRHMPIVFSLGDDAVPLGLMGLNEGVNVFFNADGRIKEGESLYIPAYVRRYPYMLARLRPDAEELSLCFDPTSDTVGAFDEGDALFEDGKPTELVQAILKFNEEFEIAGQKTNAFIKELNDQGLLMDGEVAIQPDGAAQPYIYRGFRMVDENKLNELRGDQLRKMQQNGMLPLIYAHLFSLGLMREIFGRQLQQGDVAAQPVGVPAA
ncbi:MAG: multidrug transporter [Alphaproteobacteria bacterium HGW-Alphaproteobacteria-16]|nr:MAG: multidrug transporter [Alphaproteobacteria bacterium HGW-Alphaproteobacteria-16]